VRVFPAEVWVRFNTHLNATEALLLSWPLLLVPLVLLPFLARSSVHWPAPTRLTTAESLRRQLGLPLMITCGLLAAVLLLLSLGLPLGQLLLEARTWEQLPEAWLATAPVAWNTFVLGAVTATCCLALGLLTWRFRAALALWVAFLLPGVFVGIALIHLLNRPWTQALYQSLAIIILAWTCRFVALAWHAVRGGANRLDPALIDAARMDGAGTWLVFRHAWWPQISTQLCGAWYLIFLLCLWDAETLLLVYPPGGETIALRIFNLLHYGHTGQVNALILLLIVLALLPLLALVVPRLKRLALPLTALLLLTGCSRSADFDSRIFSGVEIIGERGTALGQFNKPRSVALDLHDNLFVVDMTGRVQKFGPDGKFISSWQMQQTELGKPKGMCRDAAGRIVVLEPHYSRVNHYEPNGKLVQQWGTHGTNTGQLALPRAVACTPDGRIYVSEYGMTERVQCFSAPGGALTQVIGRAGSGPGQFNRPEGLGVDSAGGLYVADSCNHRIQVLGPDGAFIRAYGRPGQAPTEMSYPYDVRVDPAGLQFVCEFGNSRIQVFDARDQVQEILGGPGSAPGRFHNPWSIALDSRGNLYVADSGNHRVQKFVRRQPLPSKT
jgi:ABC-type spermidine/putrescine transport system permease subunit II/sugar lactone lactonase YvrE